MSENMTSAVVLGYQGLAGWLGEPADPDAGTHICAAAVAHFQVGAAWLLVPEGDVWTIRGRARESHVRIENGIESVDCHVIPLSVRGNTVGALALWPLPTIPDLTADESRAYLTALASTLGTRQVLAEQGRLVGTDPLTDLANRRSLEISLERQIALARRNQRPLTVVMFDLDHFKGVNDRFGHDDGDSVLRVFARTLMNHVRTSDLPARFGGEEFVLILPETSLQEGTVVAEKIRQTVESLTIPVTGKDGRDHLKITVSAGVTDFGVSDSIHDLLDRADHALYRAKETGRNRCVAISRPVQK
jgi:diguanylate cyclase (GGDEF)-like protein